MLMLTLAVSFMCVGVRSLSAASVTGQQQEDGVSYNYDI